MSDFTTTIAWFRRLAKEGGKGVVNNIDARSLGRIADEMEAADRKHAALLAAATALTFIRQWHEEDGRGGLPIQVFQVLERNLAALRAAGIPKGD